MHIPVTAEISLTEFRPSDKATCIERIGDQDIVLTTLMIVKRTHAVLALEFEDDN